MILHAEQLQKTFRSGAAEIRVLDKIDLRLSQGEMVALVGASGAGKSTLLHLLGALDTPTSGAIYFQTEALATLDEGALSRYRNESVGFVWQRHHLLPDFTAAENVAMPLRVRGVAADVAHAKAESWLAEVGLAGRGSQRAGELSGGEQQRVAIARALVTGPKLLLADEPTGDLDEQNAVAVFELFARLHRTLGLSTILATHNAALARQADRVLRLESGILHEDAGAEPGVHG
ncbi:MAG: ABC transporter ATP-binding protein [Acidobacteria bacterium]|nr:ABC transporter ATP-binding protein [Acidobacteriota bacterium]